ncbi:MAG: hypothetical protein AAFR47_07745 [Pseudomonadota bacterium]
MIHSPNVLTRRKTCAHRAGALALCAVVAAGPATAEYVLSLEGTGLREYYCQITVALENTSEAPLTEISGYFYNYVGDEKVGRSKGTWFMGVDPGARAEATFETPNAPCDAVERYEFVVGACRIGAGFEDVGVCAAQMRGTGPIVIVTPGGS